MIRSCSPAANTEVLGDESRPLDAADAGLTAGSVQGRSGAVSVIAMAERGALFDPGPCMYMEKLAVGPAVNPHMVSLLYPIERNIKAVASALNKPVKCALPGLRPCQAAGRAATWQPAVLPLQGGKKASAAACDCRICTASPVHVPQPSRAWLTRCGRAVT